jgi:hypothetical protein
MKQLVKDVKSLESDIKREARALFDERVESLPDRQGRTILSMCSLVLAAYRQLKQRLGDPDAAFQTVRMAFERTYATPMRWYFRFWLWMCRDPVGSLQNSSMARVGQWMYGKSMEFADDKSEHSADMLVTRCAFHQFFVEHGEPTLTLLVCAWDRNWMDVVDQSSRPIRTERASTISTGSDSCRFRFVRDEDKSGKQVNDIVLVQLEHDGKF